MGPSPFPKYGGMEVFAFPSDLFAFFYHGTLFCLSSPLEKFQISDAWCPLIPLPHDFKTSHIYPPLVLSPPTPFRQSFLTSCDAALFSVSNRAQHVSPNHVPYECFPPIKNVMRARFFPPLLVMAFALAYSFLFPKYLSNHGFFS